MLCLSARAQTGSHTVTCSSVKSTIMTFFPAGVWQYSPPLLVFRNGELQRDGGEHMLGGRISGRPIFGRLPTSIRRGKGNREISRREGDLAGRGHSVLPRDLRAIPDATKLFGTKERRGELCGGGGGLTGSWAAWTTRLGCPHGGLRPEMDEWFSPVRQYEGEVCRFVDDFGSCGYRSAGVPGQRAHRNRVQELDDLARVRREQYDDGAGSCCRRLCSLSKRRGES